MVDDVVGAGVGAGDRDETGSGFLFGSAAVAAEVPATVMQQDQDLRLVALSQTLMQTLL